MAAANGIVRCSSMVAIKTAGGRVDGAFIEARRYRFLLPLSRYFGVFLFHVCHEVTVHAKPTHFLQMFIIEHCPVVCHHKLGTGLHSFTVARSQVVPDVAQS